MNTVDIILLIAFVPALVSGLSKGFIHQVFSLVAMVLSVWMAFTFTNTVSAWIGPLLEVNKTVLWVISFIIIVVAVTLLVNFLGSLVEKLVKVVMLGWLDKLLGVVLAIIKAALAIGVAILLFDAINGKLSLVDAEVLSNSVLYNPLHDVAQLIFPYLKTLLFKS